MNHANITLPLLLVASFLLPASSFAQTENPAEPAQLTHVDNGISYASGGIGDAERAQMNALRKHYNLAFIFAMKKTGEFQANVALTIKDKHANTLFDAESLGPMVYMKLPPGQYQVVASVNGKALSRPVSVKSGGTTDANFYWENE